MSPADKVSCFVPKGVSDTDMMTISIRATQFAGALLGDLHFFPQSSVCSTMWEAWYSSLGQLLPC